MASQYESLWVAHGFGLAFKNGRLERVLILIRSEQ